MTPKPRIRVIDLNELEAMKKDFITSDLAISFLIGHLSSPDKTRGLFSEVYEKGRLDGAFRCAYKKENFINNLIKD